jgi:predicted phosphodiesterase
MRIAVIADIHGNLPALEAVRIDIARRHVDRTINLGDCVSGPLWPREVCHLLMASDDLTIRGNHDRWVSGPDLTSMGASDRYAYSQLNQDYRSWLAALPTSANAEHGILACHGTPTSATIGILSRMYRDTTWCERIHQRSGNDWEMFRLVWSCAGTVTSSI